MDCPACGVPMAMQDFAIGGVPCNKYECVNVQCACFNLRCTEMSERSHDDSHSGDHHRGGEACESLEMGVPGMRTRELK
jgi:hypothetical protein